MSFNYKDLTYIRAALQSYSAELEETLKDNLEEEDEETISEMENDVLYLGRLISLVKREIETLEVEKPPLHIVKTPPDE